MAVSLRLGRLDCHRRHFARALGICVVLVVAPACLALGQDKPAKPNFVFILSDDQAWSGLSVQMHPAIPESKSDYHRTPNLEKLAEQGLRFSDAYSPAPVCRPTRASVLTGKSPALLKMTTVGPPDPVASPSKKLISARQIADLPPEEITIAEILKKAGYATAHFGKWRLDRIGPGEHGFDEHDGPTGNSGPGAYTDPNPKDIFGITERASAFMEKHVAAGTPFYLQLSHYATHGPPQALKSTQEACQEREPGEHHNSAVFAAMTEDLDTGVGMTLEKIEELGIADNTYVVYLGDNGAAQNISSNYPLAQGKASLWEGGIRAPMIVRGPGVRAGEFCPDPVAGWDLFPTFCELAGVDELPENVEGASLAPLLTGKGEFKRAREELVFHFPHYGRNDDSRPQSAIRVGDYKLLRFHESGQSSLFNLAEDIGEERDLAAEMPEKAAEIDRRLAKYLEDVGAEMPSENPDYDPDAPATAGTAGRRQRAQGRALLGPRAMRWLDPEGELGGPATRPRPRRPAQTPGAPAEPAS
jgi:arylsulfatase A